MQHTDKRNVLALAEQEALKEGFEGAAAKAFVTACVENFEKGKAEERAKAEAEKRESAKNLLIAGVDAEIIVKSLSLSVEEVESLK